MRAVFSKAKTLFGATSSKLRYSPLRQYHFASTKFAETLNGIPDVDTAKLRKQALDFMATFDPEKWTRDPVVTMLNGKALDAGTSKVTIDAFGKENGKMILANPEEVDAVIAHMSTPAAPRGTDYRSIVRKIEQAILSDYAGALIGNQSFDFGKQDGVTEIEEALQANVVEQRQNDQLLADEILGRVSIERAPAFAVCVSNFSNFLDLCRKCLRNLELGVPVVILSRENTTQHMFRWAQILVDLCAEHGLDSGMVTYLSCSLEEQQRVFKTVSADSPLYFTGSRPVAKALRTQREAVMCSTGGPNTMVADRLTPEISEAMRMSACIENAGQCTALRHAVVGGLQPSDAVAVFDSSPTSANAQKALNDGEFSALLDSAKSNFNHREGYSLHPDNDNIAFKVSSTLPSPDVNEEWRNVYTDFTTLPTETVTDPKFLQELSEWLVTAQPISLAVNTAADASGSMSDFSTAKSLFEKTGMVVYTLGTEKHPALTCQARPQEGEVFGELPPRHQMSNHTKFPVIVPSPTPGYNSYYDNSYLEQVAEKYSGGHTASGGKSVALMSMVSSDAVRGFVHEVAEYLRDACEQNPKEGTGARSTLYGLQTPPQNGQSTILRCGPTTTIDELAPYLCPFYISNARTLATVSCDKTNQTLADKLADLQVDHTIESYGEFDARRPDAFNVVRIAGMDEKFPLAGFFVQTLLCAGHIKSAVPNDEAFFKEFKSSSKWLQIE